MEKLMTKNVLNKLGFLGAVLVSAVGFPLIFASSASAQLPAPPVPPEPGAPGPPAVAEGGGRGRARDRFELSHGGRARPEPSRHVSSAGHREVGYSQCNRPDHVYPAR